MENTIKIIGAREHNLKNFNIEIPRNELVVVTGLSGSGKSSLAFDTIYAEGQRRYVESLSSYARLFLGQMQKPDCDSIEGLSPTIAIDQKTTSRNPRSTVGTVTEIYDYLRLLYARVGDVYCPQCGRRIEPQSIDQMVSQILSRPERTRLYLLGPIVREKKGEYHKEIQKLKKDGFTRVRIDGEIHELSDLPDDFRLAKNKKHTVEVVVDRLVLKEGVKSRLTDSLELALSMGKGLANIIFQIPTEDGYKDEESMFSANYACPHCDLSIPEISPRTFSFNNPLGACPHCDGLGELVEVDPDLVVSDPSKSLNDGCIQVIGWNFSDRKSWARAFIEALAKHYEFSLDTPWQDLPKSIQDLILYGNKGERIPIDTSKTNYPRHAGYKRSWIGVVNSLAERSRDAGSEEVRENYEQYMTTRVCPACGGARLKPTALAVKMGGLNIYELTLLPIDQAAKFIDTIQLTDYQAKIAAPIFRELRARLKFLNDVGLSYLNLARSAASLSGGEAQRIRLATQIGSGLTGVIYVLDEPSIGLHQRDNQKLLNSLLRLRDLGNTLIVVEHDEETMRVADQIIDIGPGAGTEGGYLVAQGTVKEVEAVPESVTGAYLSGRLAIGVPEERRPIGPNFLCFKGCYENNLKHIDVSIPLGTFTCITGVSGSGKSSLVNGIIDLYLSSELNRARKRQVKCQEVSGSEFLDKVITIDQSPIGRSPRSNPATYTGVFDDIRRLFAATPQARARGYKPGRFSFNVKGGRCESCKGDGVEKIEMHFLPDVYVRCEVCEGKRYNQETLEVTYKGKTIADVLDMTVEEAANFFANVPSIYRKLLTMQDVGLSYLHLGQNSTTLSGGEAQRIKLATELARRSTGKTFYILDEPTTGLHSADVHKLVDILQRLTASGNTVLVIEHNLDVIKNADYIIDLGPEGGNAGGEIVACGSPEELAAVPESYTGQFIKNALAHSVKEKEVQYAKVSNLS
ncbi:MAG: excinuclease ABC subunit UvrA [Eubacteriales bacterium]|nr:excinuclease ABC subunit UvrA [Eubacteriales bacterium]